jgi:hypothetical protein
MKAKKLLRTVAAGLLACALVATSGLAQGPTDVNGTVSKQWQRGIKITVQGKIKHKADGSGYVIRSIPEVYNIANPKPEVLEPLTKSDTTVSIEALASGDLLTIEAINVKKYQDPEKPASK